MSFRRQGARYVVLATGHLAPVIDAYLAGRHDDGVTVVAVHEARPLGTAGAVRHAAGALPPVDTVAVTNGDSLVAADLTPAWQGLVDPDLDGVIVGVPAEDAAQYGTLSVRSDGRLVAFSEKRPGAGVINAGVYLLPRRMIEAIPERVPLSLEHDVFPEWLRQGARFNVYVAAAPFLDIGTPESLDHAEGFIRVAFP